MFLGSFQPSFDSKTRRVALPKKIRDYLATSDIILSFGFEKCIFGFDSGAWEKESARQLSQPIVDKSARDLRRFFFSSAELVKLDDQGRFVLPSHFLEYAQVVKPIIIGAGDHFEIWDERFWQEEKTRLEEFGK